MIKKIETLIASDRMFKNDEVTIKGEQHHCSRILPLRTKESLDITQQSSIGILQDDKKRQTA